MSLIIILILSVAVLILGAFIWYLYYRSKQLELGAARIINHARSEIEYLKAKCESQQQVMDQINYHGSIDLLEDLAKKREDASANVSGVTRATLAGQTKGLMDAVMHLRHEARRIGLKRK